MRLKLYGAIARSLRSPNQPPGGSSQSLTALDSALCRSKLDLRLGVILGRSSPQCRSKALHSSLDWLLNALISTFLQVFDDTC